MEQLFLQLLNMSITASWIVLAVSVFRFLFKKAPKAIICVLWAFVAIRLICPFSFESVLSLIPSAETIPQEIIYSKEPTINSGIPILNSSVNPIISEAFAPAPQNSANPLQILTAIAANLWIAGIVIMLSYIAVSYLRLRKRTKEAAPLEKGIWVCDRIDTPFILGVIKPRIFLPSAMNDADKQYVIAHEKAHLKRCDHLWKPLGFIILTVYWFNPVIWLAYILLCRDIELACDQRVIKEMGIENKKPYSNALINCSTPAKLITACPLAFGEVGVKGRIKSVLSYKKPSFWIIILTFITGIAVAICFLTNPITEKKIDNNLNTFLKSTIAGENYSEKSINNYCVLDYKILDIKENEDTTTVYLWTLYQEYGFSRDFTPESGSHIPVVITAKKLENDYALLEYWTPEDGNEYAPSIRSKFPWYLWGKALYSQGYIDELSKSCNELAAEYYGVTQNGVIYKSEKLIMDNGMFSFSIDPEGYLPYFLISDDFHIYSDHYTYPDLSSHWTSWGDAGKLKEFDLKKEGFGTVLASEIWYDGYSSAELIENNQKAYLAVDEKLERKYYLLEQKNGEIFIAFGYTDPDIIRHIFKVNKKQITVIEKHSQREGLTISIKQAVLSGSKPYIEIEWKNETDEEKAFGEAFDIYYHKNGKLIRCAKGDLFFNALAYLIKPNSSVTHTYYISEFDLSKSGKYRFQVGEYEGDYLWIDFLIE
ncbi:MAG: hypothetical protein IKD04_05080 [Clostridia bacterium]|nr:hypothetical protein [Clostridia bacterium]